MELELKFLLIGFAGVVAGSLSLITFVKWREVRLRLGERTERAGQPRRGSRTALWRLGRNA
ncbi:hypothetical protein EB815_24085 [Mesorhizobium loti]|nr:hypothetical protein EB815_24085 [Mesorhizobium loti]